MENLTAKGIDKENLFIRGKLYIIKAVRANMASFYDNCFIYPDKGIVTAKNYRHSRNCGHGLHGIINKSIFC